MGEIVKLRTEGSGVTQEEIEKGIIERTRKVREDSGRTQADVSRILHVGPERWRKYEWRSPIPAALLVPFCSLMEIEVEYLLTGRVARESAATKSNGSPVTLLRPRESNQLTR